MERALAKLLRVQPRILRSSFRGPILRTLVTSNVTATGFHRQSLTRPLWLPISQRHSSTEAPELEDKKTSSTETPEPKVKNTSSTETVAPEPEAKDTPPVQQAKRLWVANISYEAKIQHIRDLFSTYGEVANVRPLGRGMAFVEFKNLNDAVAAYESGQAEPLYLIDRTLDVRYEKKSGLGRQHILFFNGFNGTEKDLRKVLKEYNDRVFQIAFLPRKDGKPSNHGHIVFAKKDPGTAWEVLDKLGGQKTTTTKTSTLNLKLAGKVNIPIITKPKSLSTK